MNSNIPPPFTALCVSIILLTFLVNARYLQIILGTYLNKLYLYIMNNLVSCIFLNVPIEVNQQQTQTIMWFWVSTFTLAQALYKRRNLGHATGVEKKGYYCVEGNFF